MISDESGGYKSGINRVSDGCYKRRNRRSNESGSKRYIREHAMDQGTSDGSESYRMSDNYVLFIFISKNDTILK
jgi:hypothetical protein